MARWLRSRWFWFRFSALCSYLQEEVDFPVDLETCITLDELEEELEGRAVGSDACGAPSSEAVPV